MAWVLFTVHVYFLLTSLFKVYLALLSLSHKVKTYKFLVDDPPVYTILLPLYKEAGMVAKIYEAMENLYYPKDKLDILLILEEDDKETIAAAQALNLPSHWRVIVVPDSKPKTKPKACNYALQFAKGEIVTIYDAEDIPDRDQLAKVISMFRQVPENVVCLQASLTYYNKRENWLTRMFYIEYTYWFNFLVMGLSQNKLPIPLGGTSNHFKMDALKFLGGWNPWNVTEDAEIGIRLAAHGFDAMHLPSYTREEAVNSYWAWIKQRTRWMKGYMQTWLANAGNGRLYRSRGIMAGAVMSLFVLGTPAVALLTLPLYFIFFSWLFFDPDWVKALFPENYMWQLSWVCLVVGNITTIFFNWLASWRKDRDLSSFASLSLPVYWIGHSIAAWRAMLQLITNPYKWEKTTHGRSNFNLDGNVNKEKV